MKIFLKDKEELKKIFSASRPKAAKRPRAQRAGRHNLEAPEKVKNKEGMVKKSGSALQKKFGVWKIFEKFEN